MNPQQLKLAIIGLGYVGLPLSVEFGKKRAVTGFDINQKRIDELQAGHDSTLETDAAELKEAKHLTFTTDPDAIKACNCFIVTVPTPIDEHKRPDLTPLIKASETVGKILKKGDIVIYESTLYLLGTNSIKSNLMLAILRSWLWSSVYPVISRIQGDRFCILQPH